MRSFMSALAGVPDMANELTRGRRDTILLHLSSSQTFRLTQRPIDPLAAELRP